jgi:hypothetical protein
MGTQLKGKRIAALVDNGFEQVELIDPKTALETEGAKVGSTRSGAMTLRSMRVSMTRDPNCTTGCCCPGA